MKFRQYLDEARFKTLSSDTMTGRRLQATQDKEKSEEPTKPSISVAKTNHRFDLQFELHFGVKLDPYVAMGMDKTKKLPAQGGKNYEKNWPMIKSDILKTIGEK